MLEWKGNILYRVTEDANGLPGRKKIGEIKPSGLRDGWMVLIRRTLKHWVDTREHAVQQLERYGQT